MRHLDSKEITKMLEQLFKHMEKKGIKISDDAKDTLIKDVSSELHNRVTTDEMNHPEMKKKLMACVTAHLLNKKRDYNEILSSLKNDQDLRKTPDMKLNKKLVLEMICLAVLSKFINPENTKSMKQDEFINKMKPHLNKHNKKDTTLSDQLDATLRNLYNGNNPTMNGEIEFPILGPVFGLLCAYTLQTASDPKALSAIVDAVTYNAGKLDPMGKEKLAKLNELANSIDVPDFEASQSLRPTPSGSHR